MIYNLSDVVDDLGLHCPQCRMPAFVKKIETGPRIGKRLTVECVSGHKFKAQERAS